MLCEGAPLPQATGDRVRQGLWLGCPCPTLQGEVVLSKGLPACATFHELKVGDYLVFKANADGFKITIYDRTTSCQKVFICEEHARLV